MARMSKVMQSWGHSSWRCYLTVFTLRRSCNCSFGSSCSNLFSVSGMSPSAMLNENYKQEWIIVRARQIAKWDPILQEPVSFCWLTEKARPTSCLKMCLSHCRGFGFTAWMRYEQSQQGQQNAGCLYLHCHAPLPFNASEASCQRCDLKPILHKHELSPDTGRSTQYPSSIRSWRDGFPSCDSLRYYWLVCWYSA